MFSFSVTAHLRKIHRSEIDVELAGESDNYYKSQLLNNNNDITQISFNLLNTQQQQEQLQLAKQSSPAPTTSTTSSTSTSALNTIETSPTNISCSTPSSTSTNSLLTSNICSTVSCGLTSCSTSSSSTGTNISHTQHNDVEHHQLCNIFSSDAHDSNASPSALTLNGLVSSSNDHNLNLVTNDNSNIFLVPSTASTAANDNQLDQYFMASLIDTEQEIIVT